jgi:hypothetical protein
MARILWLLLAVVASNAQNRVWFLENKGYFDPLLADPRAAQVQVLFPGVSDAFPFSVNPGRSLVWDISVGHEFPIFGWQSNSQNAAAGVAPGQVGFGLWFPISFHMIEDMSKDPSAPILDTDYRFSGQVKLQYGLPAKWLGTSYSHVGLRFQFGHESTHVGDEFTIGAIRTHPDTFVRVNVSYEYYDLAAAFEPNFGSQTRHNLKLRGGAIWLWHPEHGWYSEDVLLYPFGEMIARSRRNYEPYGGAEYTWKLPDKQAGAAGVPRNLAVIGSLDIRDRTIYQYRPVLVHEEPTEISMNLMAGLRHTRSGRGQLGRISPTYYLRYYHGVNPNGQFRSQNHYTLFGFGVQLTL